MEADPEIIDSPLSQFYEHDGVRVEICIYRIEGTDWTLEVVDENNTSTVWDEEFSDDQAALDEFHKTIKIEGIESVSGPVSGDGREVWG